MRFFRLNFAFLDETVLDRKKMFSQFSDNPKFRTGGCSRAPLPVSCHDGIVQCGQCGGVDCSWMLTTVVV